MVITKLISGLGNQLLQYAFGRQLALARKVPLKLDISFFDNQDLRTYKLNHFNIDADIATSTDIVPFMKEISTYQNLHAKTSFYAKVYRNIEPVFYPKYTKNYFKEAVWWVYEPSVFKTPKDVYIEGYWQHYKYFENMQPQVFEELTLKDKRSDGAQKWFSNINNDPDAVAVHIRRGDYVTDSGANYLMGVLPVTYYDQAIHYIKQKVSSPNFYFFSDDLDWVKDNIETNAPAFYVDGNADYEDLDLMRHSKHNIIANSTFSWWAALLNRNTNKIVISPNQWSPIDHVNKNIKLQFPDWIKL
ncbi:alpha-1,2-fucosyltransferase [uncultured Mucilaginibacter sp.]|uniref:alpha-1,2-fucosyltransferase n=1 Tax=uncultured Mucilaginibacter sp. TaxID=797541 RepID=UPI002631CF87|nr:alpha-1,2-fucosyltransferase [uncultured Mucilaginibacter sp.]